MVVDNFDIDSKIIELIERKLCYPLLERNKMATWKFGVNLTHSQRNAGDEFFDLCCSPCTEKKLNKQAVKYCATCKEYFCASCVENHKSFKAMSKHVLLEPQTSRSTLSKSGTTQRYTLPTQLCKTHSMEVINMYCRSEDIVGCSVCFLYEHKSCDDIHYIPEYVQSNFPKVQVDKINNDLAKAIKDITKLKTHHDRLDDNLEKSKATCKQEIQKYREEINHIIDKIEVATLEDLDAKHKDAKKTTGDTNEKIKDIHDNMIRFKSEIESDQRYDSQKFVIAKLSQYLMRQGQENLMLSEFSHDQTNIVTFTRNTDIMTFLLSIVTLGMLSPPLMKESSLPTATSSSKQPQQAKPTTSPSAPGNNRNAKKVATTTTLTVIKPEKQSHYKILSKSTYNIRQQDDDETCNVMSSCILDNGNTLLTDYRNSNLKLVDSRTYTVRSSLVLKARPHSVCRVSSTEAAVCLDNITIQFVSTRGDKLVSVRSRSMKHACSCNAVIRDKMYVCSDISVYMYTLKCKLVQTISKDKSGSAIFSCICDITVSGDEKMIHVADWNKGVITLNIDGDVVWRYSGTELSAACGVCTDGNGNVIVCGFRSHNVIQLSPDGQYMGEIVTRSDDVFAPRTVCYDRNNHTLIVGQDDNNITVFTVQ